MNTNVELRNNRVFVFVTRSYVEKLTPRKFNADFFAESIFFGIPREDELLLVTDSFFWKKTLNEFYTKLLPPGYDFFGRPGLFTRLFHNSELVMCTHREPQSAADRICKLLTRKKFHGNYSRIILHNESNNAFFIERTNECFY